MRPLFLVLLAALVSSGNQAPPRSGPLAPGRYRSRRPARDISTALGRTLRQASMTRPVSIFS